MIPWRNGRFTIIGQEEFSVANSCDLIVSEIAAIIPPYNALHVARNKPGGEEGEAQENTDGINRDAESTPHCSIILA